MSEPLAALQQKRTSVLRQISELGDFRPGSITGTGGRCGNRNCHCHHPDDPGHAPHARLTYKLNGKSVTESFPTPAAQRKAEAEIETFRRYQELSRSFIVVNEQICRARPVEETLTPEKKNSGSHPARSRAGSEPRAPGGFRGLAQERPDRPGSDRNANPRVHAFCRGEGHPAIIGSAGPAPGREGLRLPAPGTVHLHGNA
jgi:hypothetical protein